jgi:predicted nucleotidyltransferase
MKAMEGEIQEVQGDPSFLAALREIVQRIARVAAPEQIILFGSAARGTPPPDSDIDLLIIKRGARRRELAGRIYQAMIGVGRPVDVVVATPEDVDRYRGSPSTVIAPALKEGKLIYAA